MILLGDHIKGLRDHIVAAHIEQMGAFQKHIGHHEDNNVVFLLLLKFFHHFDKLIPPGDEVAGVHAGYLADADVLLGNVELLIVGPEKLLGGMSLSK